MVIRMLKELIGHFNKIKKTQAEINITLSEIRKNFQGINCRVDEAKNQINDLEYKEEKKFNQNSKKKKELKKKKTRIG